VLALIRHAHAGHRTRWEGDDRVRPLTKRGRRQAEGLVAALASVPLDRILSSPYQRCLETVEPLARRRGLEIEQVPELAEGARWQEISALLRQLAGVDVALCTHGDVMVHVLDALVTGRVLSADDLMAEKGGTWLLETAGGEVVGARYVPAPKS
jgi:phosphohistidine phosphatase SixA